MQIVGLITSVYVALDLSTPRHEHGQVRNIWGVTSEVPRK